MKKYFRFPGYYLLVVLIFFSCSTDKQVKRNYTKFLVLTTPESWKNPLTSPLLNQLNEVAQQFQAGIDTANAKDILSLEHLTSYSTIILPAINPNTFSPSAQNALERYGQGGGGIMVLNAATLQPYTWPWMQALGTRELPKQEVVQKTSDEASTRYFYTKSYGGGQVALSRISQEETESADFTSSLTQVLTYLIADNTFYPSRISLPEAPDPSRFTKIVLDENDVNEPMELAVLPDGKVIFIERRGKMKLYDPEKGKSRILANFDVCTEGNYEDGLLGLALDPNFTENHYLYLYYSPPCETTEQYLSRFTMVGTDSLNLASEKVMLKVPVQRETCCHSGGSVTFDKRGYLYLSTGDNTSSKESDGYTPIDERPGRGPFDAQKSSANTHDLRGKILRIKPHPFGHYTIPDGNLFPKDGSEGRPEIYVMGARNPFRISVDDETGFVYWGDVGPDVGEDGKYGPQSYDEWNQARKPGFFGWPYFVGNNQAYFDRDFTRDQVGAPFNPALPVNNSPNNTGRQQLPEAKGAFIWYPKAYSQEFPMLGAGSNSAMAGPIFYEREDFQNSNVKFPAYFEGKLFIYEWARSWVKVISMNEEGDLEKIENFLPKEEFVKPIEMEFGPDGAMYILEYGQNYFMNNPKARLTKIEYANGNRLPVPAITASQKVGAAPLSVDFSAEGSFDYDPKDTLRYEWYFTDSTEVQSTGKKASFTFKEPGVYQVEMKAIDLSGESERIRTTIKVGNQPPKLAISLTGNTDFYLGPESLPYEISVNDPEDQSQGGINREALDIQFAYVSDGYDVEVVLGEKGLTNLANLKFLKGKQLIAGSDCSSCHAMDLQSVGPSYEMVADRYATDPKAIEYLAGKIISGGNGVWGEKIMAGHPQHNLVETRAMARYILSLSTRGLDNRLSPKGSISTTQHGEGENGAYILAATYTDGGANGIDPIQVRKQMILRYPRLLAEENDICKNVYKRMAGEARDNLVYVLRKGGYLGFQEVDMTGIKRITVRVHPSSTGRLSVRIGSEEGPEIGSISLRGTNSWEEKSVRISPQEGKQALFLVASKGNNGREQLAEVDWISFQK